MNLFAGVEVADEQLPDYIRIPMWVFCGWIGLFSIVLHIYQACTRKTGKNHNFFLLQNFFDFRKHHEVDLKFQQRGSTLPYGYTSAVILKTDLWPVQTDLEIFRPIYIASNVILSVRK